METKNYKIYWIRECHHTDPYTEGYIGLTSQSIEKRFSDHKYNTKNKHLRNRCRQNVVGIVLLEENMDRDSVRIRENHYRPLPNIGWNINPGGDMPPSRLGKVGITTTLIGDNRTDKQKEASRKHSERMKGNNSSGKRKYKVITNLCCLYCNETFSFSGSNKKRKYCTIKCAAKHRSESLEYKELVSKNTKMQWENKRNG